MPASVYIVLGLPDSGRRDLVLDLVENGLPPTEEVTLIHAKDACSDLAEDRLLQTRPVTVKTFTFKDGAFDGLPDPRQGEGTWFLLPDGRLSLIDQMEALRDWFKAKGVFPARVLLTVHCAMAAENPLAAEWHDAAVHFADYVFLNRREGVSPEWIQAFEKKYKEAFFPCKFERLRKGSVKNPALVLYPEPRRMTLIFDDLDAIDTLEIDEDNLPDEPFDLTVKEDPYFERMRGGRRCKSVPHPREFLPEANEAMSL